MIFSGLVAGVGAAVSNSALLPVEEDWFAAGLHVVAHEAPEGSRAALYLRLPGGASLDPPDRAGQAHLLEHLAFAGTERAPGGEYDRRLAAVGGSSNGWTTRDALILTCDVPAEALPLALALERDRWGGLSVSEDALATQRAVVARERAERARSTAADHLLARALWPVDHPYARSVLGTDEALAKATAEELRAAWLRITGQRGTLLVIVAPRPARELVGLARAAFGDVNLGTSAAPLPPLAPSPAPGGRRWARDDVSPPRVRLAWRLPLLSEAEAAALDLLCELIRARLPEGVTIRRWDGAAGGELVIAGADERPEVLLRRMQAVVRKEAEDLTPAALAAVAARLRTHDLSALETASGRAGALADCVVQTRTPDCLPSRWKARAAVAPSAVAEVAARLTPISGAVSVVLTGPEAPPILRATRMTWP